MLAPVGIVTVPVKVGLNVFAFSASAVVVAYPVKPVALTTPFNVIVPVLPMFVSFEPVVLILVRALTLNAPNTFVVAAEFPMVVMALPVVLISVCPVMVVFPNHVFSAVNPWTDVFFRLVSPVPVTLRPPVPDIVNVLSLIPTVLLKVVAPFTFNTLTVVFPFTLVWPLIDALVPTTRVPFTDALARVVEPVVVRVFRERLDNPVSVP